MLRRWGGFCGGMSSYGYDSRPVTGRLLLLGCVGVSFGVLYPLHPSKSLKRPDGRSWATAGSRRARRLDQLGPHAAQVGGMQEGDRRPPPPVPRPLVDQPDAGAADSRAGVAHVADAVAAAG